jgi:alpha-amylase
MALRHLQAPLLAATLLTGTLACGCMSFDDAAPITLSTHVSDWRDEIIYQVLIDRFADGDQGNDYGVDPTSLAHYQGGDWLGLEQHLDYVQALGVTTLWISPVVKNVDSDSGFSGYHGYWTQDFNSPNPHFGDVPALRRLTSAAHGLGMKVILDIVVNHMGQLFYYDINDNGQPDVSISGGGCDKWDSPTDSASNSTNLYPDYSNPNGDCIVLNGQSGVEVVNEYDPEFDPTGVIQAYSSLGYSGPAPIVFLDEPSTNHMPPDPAFFQNIEVFNRRGGTVNYGIGDQLVHGDFPGGLKDLATYRCDVKQAMVDAYATWVETADFDGLRIDTVKHVEPEFWRYFSQKMRQRLDADGKKNFFMFGETFDGDDALVGSFTINGATPGLPVAPQDFLTTDLAAEQSCVSDGVPLTGDMLDSAFYFPQYYTVINDVLQSSPAQNDVLHNGGATQQIQTLWNQRVTDWGSNPAKGGIDVPPNQIPVNFLDNHDVGRFLFYQNFGVDLDDLGAGRLTQAQFDEVRAAKLKNAYVFMFTEQGVPCVYYGDEQGFQGGNDPTNREILWPSNYVTTQTTDPVTGVVYGTYFAWIQKLTALRKKYSAFTHGDQSVVWATNDIGSEADAGIFAFERTGGDAGTDYGLVVLNTNRDHASSPTSGGNAMKVTAAPRTVLVDVLAGTPVTYTVGADGTLTIQVPPLGAAVLVPQSQIAGD